MECALDQAERLTYVPGVISACLTPDGHVGEISAVGCETVVDSSNPRSVLMTNFTGPDIGCTMSLCVTDCTADMYPFCDQDALRTLLQSMKTKIGVGVGGNTKNTSFFKNEKDVVSMLTDAFQWMNERGFNNFFSSRKSRKWDFKSSPITGVVPPSLLHEIILQVKRTIVTLGAGNHFSEIGVVDEIYDVKAAAAMNVFHVGQITVCVHCGSRYPGFIMHRYMQQQSVLAMKRDGIKMPKNLTGVLYSKEGKEFLQYFEAMCNFAIVNNLAVMRSTIEAMKRAVPLKKWGIHLISYVSHNRPIVKQVDGRDVIHHLKGACDLQNQPGVVGGSMGTYTFVVEGDKVGPHGGGRKMNRGKCRKEFSPDAVEQELLAKGIVVDAPKSAFSEEGPGAYNDVDDIVTACKKSGIATPVFRYRPLAVLKG